MCVLSEKCEKTDKVVRLGIEKWDKLCFFKNNKPLSQIGRGCGGGREKCLSVNDGTNWNRVGFL